MGSINKRAVFILSPNYSGSTMLGLILGSHSQCEYIGEFSKLKNFHANKENYEQAKEWNFCNFCEKGTCDLFLRVKTYRDALLEWPDKLLIDTSKKNLWIERNKKYLKGIIYIDRPTKDIIASFEKRGKHRKDWVERLRKSKSSKLKYIKKHPHLIVSYDSICNGNGIEDCCSFLGLKYEPEMKKFWVKKHHGAGNKELAEAIRKGLVTGIKKR